VIGLASGGRLSAATEIETVAEVAELADARDSKSREVTPHVGSIPTFGTHKCTASLPPARMEAELRVRRAPKVFVMEMF
jgi:hypothetical protein